jgi:hypothetical protein
MKKSSIGTKKAVMIPSLLLPLIVATAQWVCFTSFVCRYESKSSADDSNYSPWNQIAQKIGDWLRPPCILWWWAWILIQIDTGSLFPRGESPPQHTSRRGVSKDAPRGSPFVVICDYLHTKAAAKTGTPIPRIFWTQAVSNSTKNQNQVRPEETLPRHLILLFQASA